MSTSSLIQSKKKSKAVLNESILMFSKSTGNLSETTKGLLDHNNFMKSVGAHANSGHLSVKILKTTKSPALRKFPGELREIIRESPIGAVYAEDLEREEAERKAVSDVIPVVPKDELMLQSDFLKLDQSKLPIEIFDSLEYESIDKSPVEWLSICSSGHTPFFHQGKWHWREVEILGFHESSQKYHVKFNLDGIEKHVHRLNLRFNAEDATLFNQRRAIAEAGREEAKRIMRFDHFILEQPKEQIRSIGTEGLKKIQDRIVDGLPIDIPLPEPGTPLGALLKSSLAEMIQWYSRSMKKIVVFTQLVGTKRNEAMISRYNQLDLPQVPKKSPVPRIGKVECPEYQFDDRRNRLEHMYISSQCEILELYKWLYSRWSTHFQHFTFVDTEIKGSTLPYPLDVFKKSQLDMYEVIQKQIRVEFRRAFMDQMLDCVQDSFDFFQSNVQVYKHGSLFKLFRVLDMHLADFLRRILLGSLDKWTAYIVSKCEVSPFSSSAHLVSIVASNMSELEENSLDGVNGTSGQTDADSALDASLADRIALATQQDGSSGVDMTDPSAIADNRASISHSVTPSARSRVTEWKFPVITKPSLFQAELKLVEGKVIIEPSHEDIEEVLLQAIDRMVTATRAVTSVDKDIMSLMTLEVHNILDLGAGNPLYRDIDESIENAKLVVSKNLSDAMKRPLEFVALFNEYCWIIEQDVHDYLDAFSQSDPPPKIDQYREELVRVNSAVDALTNLSFQRETFELLEIDTENVKKLLCTTALAMRNGLLQLIVIGSREENMKIVQEYKSILDRIGQKPSSEKELADLREFIVSSRDTVEELKTRVEDNRRYPTLQHNTKSVLTQHQQKY